MALTDNLERWYELDGNGVDAHAGQNATTTVAVFGPGKLGQSAEFSGSSTVNQIRSPGLNLLGDLSIAFWWKYHGQGSPGYCPAVSQMIGAGGADINYAILQNGNILQFYGTGNAAAASTTTAPSDTWEHIVFTRTTAGSVSCYVNTALSPNSPFASVGPHSVVADLVFGHRDDNYSGFDGALDGIGIWSRILSGSEISQLYNSGSGVTYASITPALPPTVVSITPASGPSAGATFVTISGSAFVPTPTVTIGGAAATSVAFVNSGSLTAITPAGSVGARDVVVTNPDLQSGSLTGSFTYLAPTVTNPRFGDDPRKTQFERGIKWANVPGGRADFVVHGGPRVYHVNSLCNLQQQVISNEIPRSAKGGYGSSGFDGTIRFRRVEIPPALRGEGRNLDRFGNVVYPFTGTGSSP